MQVTITLKDPGMRDKAVTSDYAKLPDVLKQHSRDFTQASVRGEGVREVWSKTVNGDPWGRGTVAGRIRKILKARGVEVPKGTSIRVRNMEDQGMTIEMMADRVEEILTN